MQFPYAEVEFDKKGAIVRAAQAADAGKLAASEQATDVLVLAHGWNNTFDSARDLYERMAASLVAVRGAVKRASGRRFVVVGVLWPSILWAPPEGDGGGAGVGSEADALRAQLDEQIEDPARRAKLAALVPRLEESAQARARFVELLREGLPAGAVDDDDPDSAPEALRTADAETVFQAAGGGEGLTRTEAEEGGAAAVGDLGGAAGDGDGGGAGFLIDGVLDAARKVANLTTYYTMKERAGTVGAKGLAKTLEAVHKAAPDARLHLVGHSFGGRAVTAAALATSAPIASVSLLQAAYSHYGMAQGWDGAGANGAFWKVPGKVAGPIIVTFTKNDKAVGIAYPIASRLARQIGVGLGDANDKYGGIGRNGALKTPAALPAVAMRDVGGAYAFESGRVSSLDGDKFVSDHGDVAGRQVAYAVLTAVTTAG
ncbi:MAG: hypothetical protein QM611_05015 [Microbacterium sp.]|uniref:hypothetical protein n=1 Tax=Microbacterium sp. TaxID=51671 RepID=UPI0039E276FB